MHKKCLRSGLITKPTLKSFHKGKASNTFLLLASTNLAIQRQRMRIYNLGEALPCLKWTPGINSKKKLPLMVVSTMNRTTVCIRDFCLFSQTILFSSGSNPCVVVTSCCETGFCLVYSVAGKIKG